ncbi:DUF1015 domain-containing protein [Thiorhodovibrio frisius]|uniref:DUF1015 domain-containing protein n=2 Tax=Thiorhodovibrio frisius TaxID=631362 RepID=H8Z4L6_9GAMM|nr:DUF1015 family protein [Thiorhodovibrio frisius]EIC20273.1 hypothetical protein Thi970DRAFT_03898 [Thiorhodovibrio frisius]WPL21010.1 hypothetical protein Thiofri_01117 [Thiorhodovibrio frisius]
MHLSAMHLISPFRALRPPPTRASEVIAPPYDVMSTAEARVMAQGKPHSFLHVSRPEIDLPEGSDPSASAAYAKARENLQTLREQGLLARDPRPCLYVYRLTQGDHSQTGLAAVASVAAYRDGRIKKHELTRPAKENDRVRHIEALDAQTGPVFLIHRGADSISQQLAQHCAEPAQIEVLAEDGVNHQIWVIQDQAAVGALCADYNALDALYIADGHHRAAAAARVAEARPDDPGAQDFLAVTFPDDQTRILAYNRLIRDLNGLTTGAFLKRLEQDFDLSAQPAPVTPEGPGIFGLYIEQHWYRLAPKPHLSERLAARDPAGRLDTSLLQDFLIQPILGIDNPRTDERIDFVGGSRGIAGLTEPVDQGRMRLALALHPTSASDLMAVSDANALMPPKSTWFEPKLADGLLSHLLS